MKHTVSPGGALSVRIFIKNSSILEFLGPIKLSPLIGFLGGNAIFENN